MPGVDGLRARHCSRRRPPAARSPRRAASRSSPSSPRPRPRGSPRTTRYRERERRARARARPRAGLRRRRARARVRLRVAASRGGARATRSTRSTTGRGSSPTCTCTRRGRTTAASTPAELVDHAEAEGLGAIAVTDHNVFGGALETADHRPRPRPDRDPRRGGEDRRPGRGDRALPRARDPARHAVRRTPSPRSASRAGSSTSLTRSTACTRSPTRATLHRHLADIDVFEVYNARLLFEGYNDEALRFARKYNLTMGAGSDAHVLQGVGTGALADARVPRPGGVHDLAARRPRSCAGRSRSRTCRR